MYNGQIKIGIPNWYELVKVTGQEQIYRKIFDKVGKIADQTDLVVFTQGYVRRSGDGVLRFSALTYTSTAVDTLTYVACIDNKENDREDKVPTHRNGSIRPVLYLQPAAFDEIVSRCKIPPHNGVDRVIFGYYPQQLCDLETDEKMLELLKKNQLTKVSGTYTFNTTNFNSKREVWKPHNVYEYEGKKYVAVKFNENEDREGRRYRRYTLSNGKFLKYGDIGFIQVSPVIWYVDYAAKRLYSEKNLLAGIKFSKTRRYDGKFEKSLLYNYLNEYMLPELLQYTELKLSRGKTEVEPLLKTISSYEEYNLSDEDIEVKVSALIEDFNKKVIALSESKNTNNLNIAYKDENCLYNELISILNDILDKLKSDYEKAKPYYDLLDVLKGNSTSDLSKFVSSIKKLLENKLLEEERESLVKDLDEIISKFKKRCEKEIKELKSGKRDQADENIEIDFRKELHPFLVKLSQIVEKKDIAKEIMDGVKNIINDSYTETKNLRVKYLLDIIKESSAVIKKNGNEEDKKRLKQLVNFSIDLSKDVSEILSEINEIVKQVYRIELDIKERNNDKENLKRTLIKVDVSSIFNNK